MGIAEKREEELGKEGDKGEREKGEEDEGE
jgi:hypothetical protein